MRIYSVKENPIGSAVTEILRCRHTHTDKQIYKHSVTLVLGLSFSNIRFGPEDNRLFITQVPKVLK